MVAYGLCVAALLGVPIGERYGVGCLVLLPIYY